jgi:hypothetical protein
MVGHARHAAAYAKKAAACCSLLRPDRLVALGSNEKRPILDLPGERPAM